MFNVVVIGGGTGSFTVLSGIKNIPDTSITSIVASTDSGGSTGRLRDEFGYLPVGDIRQALVALADETIEQNFLRDLLTYRFDKGEAGLKGHNFGNLFMTALRDITGSELKTIEVMGKLLKIKGKVYPITLQKCNLVAEYQNGEILEGEHEIDAPAFPHDSTSRISKLYTKPYVNSHAKIDKVIANADLIIMGPGDLYTSLIANLVINNVSDAIKKNNAKILYIANLFTKMGQTYNFTLKDHVLEIEKYLTRKVDFILFNKTPFPADILTKYKLENSIPVANNMQDDKRVVVTDLLALEPVRIKKEDVVPRSLIRHDKEKIRKVIENILKNL